MYHDGKHDDISGYERVRVRKQAMSRLLIAYLIGDDTNLTSTNVVVIRHLNTTHLSFGTWTLPPFPVPNFLEQHTRRQSVLCSVVVHN